jgi:hypothetical protein
MIRICECHAGIGQCLSALKLRFSEAHAHLYRSASCLWPQDAATLGVAGVEETELYNPYDEASNGPKHLYDPWLSDQVCEGGAGEVPPCRPCHHDGPQLLEEQPGRRPAMTCAAPRLWRRG